MTRPYRTAMGQSGRFSTKQCRSPTPLHRLASISTVLLNPVLTETNDSKQKPRVMYDDSTKIAIVRHRLHDVDTIEHCQLRTRISDGSQQNGWQAALALTDRIDRHSVFHTQGIANTFGCAIVAHEEGEEDLNGRMVRENMMGTHRCHLLSCDRTEVVRCPTGCYIQSDDCTISWAWRHGQRGQ